jgi:hypothetical protein
LKTPDIDDTAIVVMALLKHDSEFISSLETKKAIEVGKYQHPVTLPIFD